MKFFVEEKHTNKEWIWILKNRVLFYVLMIIWFLMLYFVIMLILLMQNVITDKGILTLIGVLLFIFGFFGVGQVLNEFWDIRKAIWKAKWQGKSINIEFKDGNQIVKIMK